MEEIMDDMDASRHHGVQSGEFSLLPRNRVSRSSISVAAGAGAGGPHPQQHQPSNSSKKKKSRTPSHLRTLALLLGALEGTAVIVETKHDEVIRGTIRETDKDWNCYLENVTVSYPCHPAKQKQILPIIFVKGNLVRYVHFPDSVEPNAAVEAHRERLKKAARAFATQKQPQPQQQEQQRTK